MSLGTYCLCCLTRPPNSDFKKPNTIFDKTEVYADMIKECFEINVFTNGEYHGICTLCVERLRDALDFKQQVVRCQKQLQIKNIVTDQKSKEENVDFKVKEEMPDQEDNYDMCLYDDAIANILQWENGDVKLKSERKRKGKRNIENTDRKTRKHTEKLLKKMSNNIVKPISPVETLTDHMKFKYNIQNILTYSNCTPFSNRTIAGIICAYCKESYKNIGLLSVHCKENHPRALDETKKYCKETVSIKMDISDLQCNICHAKINLIAELKNHLSKEHDIVFYTDVHDYILEFRLTDSEIFNCVLCYSKFETFKMLLQHMNGHYRNYVCDVCDMGFINQHRLRNHKRTHELGAFKCNVCDKVFDTKVRQICHEKYTHNRKARYTTNCPHCEKSFSSYYQRNRHMKCEHNMSAATYKCNMCERTFLIKSKLTSHIKKVHLMERNHICPECGLDFFIKQSLDEHMIRHNGEKIFKCTVCCKAYARKKTLVEHMRIHNNDKRFKCGVCGLAFVQKCSMKSHMLTNHGVTLAEFERGKTIGVTPGIR